MMESNNCYFVTGASGFIGGNLAARLLSQGDRVYALTRGAMPYTHNLLTIIRGDITHPESFSGLLKGCDALFHCAALVSFQRRDFQKAYHVNVEGTRKLLEAAYQAGVPKVVHLSACAVLGFSSDMRTILNETAQPEIKQDNIYAYTKKLAEEEVQRYVQKGLNVSIANSATVYGRGDGKLNSGTVIKSVYHGKMKCIPPGGTSFISVNDLVEGLILLEKRGKAGERYIFCTENMEYRILIERIARTLNVKAPRYVLPRGAYYPLLLMMKGVEFLSGGVKNKINLINTQILKEAFSFKYFSSKKAEEELGWKPKQSLEETVRSAVAYYKEKQLI